MVAASVPQVALETVQPLLLMVLINAIVAHDTRQVWMTVLGLIGLIPTYIAGNFLFEYVAARVGASVSNDLRIAAFWRLQALSVGYHRGRSARRSALPRFSSDLDAVERTIVTEFPFALVPSQHHRGRHPAAFVVEWRLGLALRALLPMVVLGPRWLGERASRASCERQQDAADVMSSLEEASRRTRSSRRSISRASCSPASAGSWRCCHRSTVRASLLSGLQGTSISGSGSILLISRSPEAPRSPFAASCRSGGLVAIIDLLWFIVANLHALSKVLRRCGVRRGGMIRIQEVLDEARAGRRSARTPGRCRHFPGDQISERRLRPHRLERRHCWT